MDESQCVRPPQSPADNAGRPPEIDDDVILIERENPIIDLCSPSVTTTVNRNPRRSNSVMREKKPEVCTSEEIPQ
ncbi:hypothetical protein Bhyg_08236, partial [Pseudolycoriella hygida]